MPTESIEVVENATPEITELPVEEELTPLPASDETAADAKQKTATKQKTNSIINV